MRPAKRLAASLLVSAAALGAQSASALELITNGGFEADGVDVYSPDPITGWTASSAGIIGGAGVIGATTSPGSGFAVPGPASGGFYAFLDAAQPSVNAISQTFSTIGVTAATLSFKLFALDAQGIGGTQTSTLDYTNAPNQYLRVDLLKSAAGPFDTGTSIVTNLLSADGSPIAAYGDYSFDLTPWLATGGSYQLRFASVANAGPLVVGIDDVSLDVRPVPEPSAWAMLAAGLAALGFTAQRRRRG